METRREFIRKMGLAGMTATIPGLLDASDLPDAPSSHKMTILFQGDSITDGNRSRDNDWNHVMGHGYAYLIAARLWYEHVDKNLMFLNRGISGNTVQDIASRWQEDAIELQPDVISILAGINDVHAIVHDQNPRTIQEFESDYKQILDQTREKLPEALIILCEPFILPLGRVDFKPEVWKVETQKRQEIVKKLSESYNTIYVPLQNAFNKACDKAQASYWIWDGIHPMPAGHELIARQWLRMVQKQLHFIKS